MSSKHTLSMGRLAGQSVDLFVGDEHITVEITKVRGRRVQMRLTASNSVRMVRREALNKQGNGESDETDKCAEVDGAGDTRRAEASDRRGG